MNADAAMALEDIPMKWICVYVLRLIIFNIYEMKVQLQMFSRPFSFHQSHLRPFYTLVKMEEAFKIYVQIFWMWLSAKRKK